MNSKHAIKVILNERECVNRADKNLCTRDCANCDLVMNSSTIKEAYTMAIESLALMDAIHSQRITRHCFDGGMYISIKDIQTIENKAKESVYANAKEKQGNWFDVLTDE